MAMGKKPDLPSQGEGDESLEKRQIEDLILEERRIQELIWQGDSLPWDQERQIMQSLRSRFLRRRRDITSKQGERHRESDGSDDESK
jgi:hypothetical protein